MRENKLMYLEFLQNNVARMNQCSFQIKGLAVAIVAALLAIYAATIGGNAAYGNVVFVVMAIIPTIIFWALDSYYLSKEKDYRMIYEIVADLKSSDIIIKDFCLDPKVLGDKQTKVIETMFKGTERSLYGTLILFLMLFSIFAEYVL